MVDISTIYVYNIMIDWKRECNIEDVAINVDYISSTLIIYTELPGVMVGKAGCIYDKYAPLIKAQGFENIEFRRINSFIGNKKVENPHKWVEEYYKARGL